MEEEEDVFLVLQSPHRFTEINSVCFNFQASVSLKRLGRFLQQGDIDFDNVQHDTSNREYLMFNKI